MDSSLRERAEALRGRRVLVLGDIIADEYLLGLTSRVSREAPVLILKHQSRELKLGGAGNAANNVRDLGGEVRLLGVLGDDPLGGEVLEVLEERGIDASGVLRLPGVETTRKTRILAGGVNTAMQQVFRMDREGEGEIPEDAASRLASALKEMADEADSVLISDYGQGVVGPQMIEAVNRLAEEKSASDGGLPVLVDSRYRLNGFRGATAVTPNEVEMREILAGPLGEEALFREAEGLRQRLGFGGLLLTRGKKGMVLFEAGRSPQSLAIFGGDDVADVTGAGDTVIGTFTLSLASGAGMWESAQLANVAGGLVVMKQGTATVSHRELLEAL